MNSISFSTFFIIFAYSFLSFTPDSSNGLRCWFCSSDSDSRCGDPFMINSTQSQSIYPSTFSKQETCEGAYNYSPTGYACRKVKHKVNDHEIVVRQCVNAGSGDYDPCSPNALSSFSKVEHCSVCTTDACNSAPTVFQVTAATLLPAILLILRKSL